MKLLERRSLSIAQFRTFHCSRVTPRQYVRRRAGRVFQRSLRVRSDEHYWRMSEAGLRPPKTPAYFLWLFKENWTKLAAVAGGVVLIQKLLQHYNGQMNLHGNGGNHGGGHGGGHGGSGGGGGNGDGIASTGRRRETTYDAQVSRATDEERRAPKRAVHLTLVSFAVTRKAYEVITERFAREYEEQTGVPVRFRLSFGGSGTQARAVVDGLPGDIVALALPLDVQKIVEAGLIRPDWEQRAPNNAIVAESVVAIVTRPGNPKGIKDWDDLTRPDVDVITANPKTAGVARWNFLALWGRMMDKGDDVAQRFVTDVFHRVPIQPRDAREASDVFYTQGQGDVLLNYENEVIITNASYSEDKKLPYVVPPNNIRVETPVAVVDRNLDRRSPSTRTATRAAAEAFVQYLFTPAAQREFSACGFRLKDPKMSPIKLPKVKQVWTVSDKLGGWDATQRKFFAGGGILDQIQNEVGEFRRKQRQGGKQFS